MLCSSRPPRDIVGERYGSAISDLQRLGLLTGCRLGELCNIRAEDVLLSQTVQVSSGSLADVENPLL